jgi:hypothetical protein
MEVNSKQQKRIGIYSKGGQGSHNYNYASCCTKLIVIKIFSSWDGSFGIIMGYRLNGKDSIPSRVKRYFSSPQCPDHIWSQLSIQLNGYQDFFPMG